MSPKELQEILRTFARVYAPNHRRGSLPIDATQPLASIIDEILAYL